jgi:hypothetical protein
MDGTAQLTAAQKVLEETVGVALYVHPEFAKILVAEL